MTLFAVSKFISLRTEKGEMSRYHVHLIYAVNFAMTYAMQYMSSETSVSRKANTDYNMQELNPKVLPLRSSGEKERSKHVIDWSKQDAECIH